MRRLFRWISALAVLVALVSAGGLAQARGTATFIINWPTDGPLACVQSIRIDVFDTRDFLFNNVAANRLDCKAQVVLTMDNIRHGDNYFRAVAFSQPYLCGQPIGEAWGQLTPSSNPAPVTINEACQGVQLHIEPHDALIFPNQTRQLLAVATNPNCTTALLPLPFNWTSDNDYRARVDWHSGVVEGWWEKGNATITVTNPSMNLCASTKVLNRAWATPSETW